MKQTNTFLKGRKRTRDLRGDAPDATGEKLAALGEMKAAQTEHRKPAQAVDTVHQSVAPATVDIAEITRLLCEKMDSIGRSGTAQRLTYSPRAQHNLLVAYIKSLMIEKANYNREMGLGDTANRNSCQAFVDELCESLRAAGLEVGDLQVVPEEALALA